MFDLKEDNVTLGSDEQKRISGALELLAKDPHAPREISVRLTLHIHNEYPKHMYKDHASRQVANEEEEAAAAADGFGDYDGPAPAAPAEAPAAPVAASGPTGTGPTLVSPQAPATSQPQS